MYKWWQANEGMEKLQRLNVRLLDRFYAVFELILAGFLAIGVPFVFERKPFSAALCLVLLAIVIVVHRMNRRGAAEKSLLIFTAAIWLVLVGLVYVGVPPVLTAPVLAVAVMLAIVVNVRAGLYFASSYLVAWLGYIVLNAVDLAPPVLYSGRPMVPWLIGAFAIWLVLLPIPELVKRMRESSQYVETILDNALDGIIAIDERGIVESFNRGAQRIFGYSEEEMVGRNVSMLMPEPYRSRHDAYLGDFLRSGAGRIIGRVREVSGQRKGGEIFPIDLALSEVGRAGQRVFIGVVRDVSERQQAERMKNEFISIISHELRTPLTSISGALGLLLGGALGKLPEQAQSLVDIASRNSKRLNVLIDDLLDMEKIAAGKLQFDMKVQALMPLVEQALAANQGYAFEHQVRLAIVERADQVKVRVDSRRVMQVLANLLSNAAKFAPRNDTVELAVRQTGDWVRVSVRDRGPGVPLSFRAHIFQKFSQADSSDMRRQGGTGLGLAITRELLQRMGGSVGFDSVEGEGATFYFDLPVCGIAPEREKGGT